MRKMALLAALLVVAGCATSAPDRSARTASTLEALKQNSEKARGQIDTVLASLDGLLEANSDRLRESYDRYAADVKKMNDYAEAIRDNDADLRKNGNAYLKQWQKDASDISDPELRALAEQRQSEIAANTASMRSTVSDASTSFAAFLKDINDIQKVIGNDLTQTGQASVRNTSVAQSARHEGARVKAAIENAEQAVAGLRSQITPTGN